MAQILQTRKPSLSKGFAKRFAGDSVGVATTGLVIVAGLGILALALPFVQKTPIVGRVFGAGGAGAAQVKSSYGRVM